MQKILSVLFLSAILLITSCGSDDDDAFIPLDISTQEDLVEVSNLETILIPIFSNDLNIPKEGDLSISNPANGSVIVTNNNTPGDIRDDVIEYGPNLNFVGVDTFQYIICQSNGTGCKTETVTITVLTSEITTQEDIVRVSTLETISINIFDNDINVPINGTLSLTNPSNGDVVVHDNNTPDDLRDDVIAYDPNLNFFGEDTFQYTICQNDGTGCKTESVAITVFQDTTVTLDLANFPYNTLSEYNFFNGSLNAIDPAYGVLPYKPISALFTDYAIKERFVWIPVGEKATYNADDKALVFPTGSALIKMFYYNNVLPGNTTRIIETRVMVKTANGWDFAEYVWNDAQTEAFLETTEDGDFTEIEWLQEGEPKFVNYRIPAKQQCIICHTNDFITVPIGIKPQNINSNLNYDDGINNQLQKLIDFGYLEDNLPATITTVVDWKDASQSLEQRAKSYLDINCGNCHTDGGQGDYRSIRLGYTDTLNNDENAGVCVDADTPIPGLMGQKHIAPGDPENSIIYYRMSVTGDEPYKMPQFGQNLVHTEALLLMEDWINSINQTCD